MSIDKEIDVEYNSKHIKSLFHSNKNKVLEKWKSNR